MLFGISSAMEGLVGGVKREVSSSWCKLFPLTSGCSSSDNKGSNNSGKDSKNNNNGWDGWGSWGKPTTTTTSNKAAATTTSRKTTSSSVKQSTPTTASMRYVAATTSTPQPAAATPVAAVPVVQNSPEVAAAPAPATTQQQAAAPAAAQPTTTQQAPANTPEAAKLEPTTSPAADTSPAAAPEATADTAKAAGAVTTSSSSPKTTTTVQSSGISTTRSSSIPAGTKTAAQKHPTSSSVPGTVIGSDGGRLDQGGSTTTTNKTPAIVGAVVGVLLVAIIAVLIYRYRRSRVVRPMLLPFACAKRRKPDGDAASPPPTMREKTSRESLLSTGGVAGALPSPTYSVAPPYSPTTSDEHWIPPGTLAVPQSSFQSNTTGRDGIRRVAIPRDQRLVPLGDNPADPSSLEAGFSIPPSPPGSRRTSVSSLGTMRPDRSRTYSTFSAGAASVASSGVLCPVVMEWPAEPMPTLPSPLSSQFSSSNGTWMTARTGEEHGERPRHIAMYHEDNRV